MSRIFPVYPPVSLVKWIGYLTFLTGIIGILATLVNSTPAKISPPLASAFQAKSTDFVPVLIIPTSCGAFSPDSSLIAGGDGVYEVATRQQRFTIDESPYSQFRYFSAKGTYLMVEHDGIYKVETGQQLFQMAGENPQFNPTENLIAGEGGVYELINGYLYKHLTVDSGHSPRFSPDGRFLAVGADGVYNINNKSRLFSITGYRPRFSPDSTLVAVSGDGVYEIATGQKRFRIHGLVSEFNVDGTLLAVGSDGVYDVKTGVKRFTLGDNAPEFSPDGTLLAASNNGVYDLKSGLRRFEISGYGSFSPDGKLLIVSQHAVYEVATGQKLFEIDTHGWFSPDGKWLALNFQNACLLYTNSLEIKRETLPANGTVIATDADSELNIYAAPSLGAEVKALARRLSFYLVYARTSDSIWYKIGDHQWIPASAVGVISMPEDLPVEDE